MIVSPDGATAGSERWPACRKKWRAGAADRATASRRPAIAPSTSIATEAQEFQDYLARLRAARDKQEFDQYMAERQSRNASPANRPDEGPSPQPPHAG